MPKAWREFRLLLSGWLLEMAFDVMPDDGPWKLRLAGFLHSYATGNHQEQS